ncbi:MAG: carboxypeptidase-like regulatory domain-containing protein, partial [Gemmatimonadaceae bacterium]
MVLTGLRLFRAATLVIVGALLFAVPAHLRAQALRGRVVFASDNAPLVGSIVQARRADGTVAASVLTSETGIFAFTGLAPGTYLVRVLRIGFRAFDAGNVNVSGDANAAFNIAWIGDPIRLTTQVVVAGRTCKISADSGKLIANIWDEARKALLASVITEGMTAPQLTRITYQR